jgi:hypothetical protein
MNQDRSTLRRNVRANIRDAVRLLLIAGGVWVLGWIIVILIWVSAATPH